MFGFGKKQAQPSTVELIAPAPGRVLALDEVPDPVFSGKVMGDGFAVDPTGGQFASPLAGTIILLADTLHAFAVRTAEGLEVLVHIGIDTVQLKGAGFTARAANGDEVSAGQVVVEVDLDQIRDSVPSMITPVIVMTKQAELGQVDTSAGAGQTVVSVTLPAKEG